MRSKIKALISGICAIGAFAVVLYAFGVFAVGCAIAPLLSSSHYKR